MSLQELKQNTVSPLVNISITVVAMC